MRAVILVVVVLGAVAAVLVMKARKQARIDEVIATSEAMMRPGTFDGLHEAARYVADAAAGDELAPAAFHVQGLKADLAIWALYNGAQSQENNGNLSGENSFTPDFEPEEHESPDTTKEENQTGETDRDIDAPAG